MKATLDRKQHENGRSPERYGWKPAEGVGDMLWIDKHLLNVDHDYQRSRISNAKVLEIARDWSWAACLVIGVFRRADGTFWVFDGQHRVLAAKKRSDIPELPCLVFECEEISGEAKAFILANTCRGAVKAFERFKARLTAEEPNAVLVDHAIRQIGYAVGEGMNHLKCIQAIENAMSRNRESTETALGICADLYQGQPIHAFVFQGLWFADMHMKKKNLGSLDQASTRRKLLDIGEAALLQSINRSRGFHGRGGERIYADGILTILNKGRSTRRIPSPLD